MKNMRDNVLANMPGLAIIKDENSIFLDISESCAKLLGWNNAAECLGKTDFDIPCNAKQSAYEFIKMDRAVMNSAKASLSLEIQSYNYSTKLLLVERQPLVEKLDNKQGVFIYCMDLSNTQLFNSYAMLYRFDKKLFDYEFKPACYILTDEYASFNLTDKQKNCLFLLIRGKSIKKIAAIFAVSPRTIEDHIAAIGRKLNCKTKSEVIEKTIDSGFLYHIPRFFQSKELDKIL
jgi:DNA-binding CsgD family transcriptional regulator